MQIEKSEMQRSYKKDLDQAADKLLETEQDCERKIREMKTQLNLKNKETTAAREEMADMELRLSGK